MKREKWANSLKWGNEINEAKQAAGEISYCGHSKLLFNSNY